MSASEATDVALNQLNYSGNKSKTIYQAFQARADSRLRLPGCFGVERRASRR